MPQNLIQLPKKADFRIAGWTITIRNHKVAESSGLIGCIMKVADDVKSNRDTLYQFEKHGINFETAIEECVMEIEYDTYALAWVIGRYHDFLTIEITDWPAYRRIRANVIKSSAGKAVVNQFIENIRSCDDWGELYDKLQLTTKFNKDAKKIIKKGIDQCHKT